MLETHITKDGDSILIAQMSDTHLRRMILLILNGIREVKGKSLDESLDPYQSALYEIKNIEPKDAAVINRMAIQRLYPYLAEAFLRNMDNIRDDLIDVIGRDEALPGGLPSLGNGNQQMTVISSDTDLYVDPF